MQGSVLGYSSDVGGQLPPGTKLPPQYAAQAQQAGVNNEPLSAGQKLLGGAMVGGTALLVGGALGSAAYPTIAKQAAEHPIAAQMIGSGLIGQARNIPVVGKYIPPSAELLPFLMGHGNTPSNAEKIPARNPSIPENVPTVTPEPIAAPEPASNGLQSLSSPVGGGIKDLQPLAKSSSRITHDAYDPQAQVATVRFPNGQVTEYHGISPQNWADYKNSASAGQGLEQNIINKAAATRSMPRITPGQRAAKSLNKQ
jgi:hypothetical protein